MKRWKILYVTSLLEKNLIVGFGIFILIMIFPVINQYIDEIIQYDKDRDEIGKFTNVLETIDEGITSIEKYNISYYKSTLVIPKNLEILIERNHISYNLVLSNDIVEKIIFYKSNFSTDQRFFKDSFKALIEISTWRLKIQINISSIE